MKIFSFIFSFYLLFLAFEPGVKALSFTEEQETSCCSDKSCQPIEKQQPEKKQEKKGCDETNNCNPFQTCNNCIAFTSDFVCLNLSPMISFSKPQTDNKDKVPPQITLDFWQPPKIA